MSFFTWFVQIGSAGFAVCLNIGLIFQIRSMWIRQTHEGINAILALFMFCNNFCWMMYGFLKNDWTVYVPNTLGTFLAPITLFLIVYFTHRQYFAKKSTMEH